MQFDDLELEMRRHGASLRSLALALLGDEAEAEDAVQETWARALTQPPSRPGPLGGWLHEVLRSIAAKVKRSRVRRLRRERRAARAESEPGSAAILERREILHSIVDAVHGLGQPYREVIWLRYFEGLKPAEIARRQKVPLATVKSRLQRGLQQLRTSLDRRDGRHWPALLAGCFGLDPAGVRPVSTAAPGVGSPLRLATFAAAAITLGLVGVWFVDRDPSGIDKPDASTASVDGTARGFHPPNAHQPSPVGSHTRTRVPVPAAAAATVSGRCADVGGAPLADVVCSLTIRPAPGDALDARTTLTCRTDTRGQFEFSVPLRSRGELRFSDPRRITIARNWSVPDTACDLGTVTLHMGAAFVGHVRDAVGAPIRHAAIALRRVERPRDRSLIRQVPRPPVATDGDGVFRTDSAWLPGAYRLEVAGAVIATGAELRLPDDGSTVQHTVVVHDESTVQTISGSVVDSSGQPVRGAEVGPWGELMHLPSRTDENGRFVLARASTRAADAFWIMVRHPDHATAGPVPCTWGTQELRVELGQPARLELSVFDPHGRAVRSYVARILPRSTEGGPFEPRMFEQDDATPAEHPSVYGSLEPGKVFVHVEPARADLAPSGLVPVTLGSGALTRCTIRLEAVAHRVVRVVTTRGEPVVGSRIELADPTSPTPVALATTLRTVDDWRLGRLDRNPALLLSSASTDSDGRVTLAGPAVRPLAVHVLGPGHCPVALHGVHLGPNDTLHVVVDAGATLRGRLGPPGFAADLRRRGGLPVAGMWRDETTANVVRLPGLRLLRPDRAGIEVFPPSRHPPIVPAADGAFELTGIPPGRWSIHLYEVERGAVDGRRERALVEVTLAAEQTTEVDLLQASTTRSVLSGRVLRDGHPLVRQWVVLEPTGDRSTVTTRFAETVRVDTDASAQFEAEVRRGSFGLRWYDPHMQSYRRAQQVVEVDGAGPVRADFEFVSDRVRLVLEDRNGRPVGDATIRLRASRDAQPIEGRPDAATGVVDVLVDRDTYALEYRRTTSGAREHPASDWQPLHREISTPTGAKPIRIILP